MADSGNRGIKQIRRAMFIVYLFALLYFTIFAESLGRTPDMTDASSMRYNLKLFTEISRFWKYREQLGMEAFLLNIFGNILAFVPCGYLLPRTLRHCDSFLGTALIGFLISFIIESTQYILRVGSFDVDDLLLNTVGVMLGYLLCLAVHRMDERRRKQRRVEIREIRFRQ